MRRVVFRKTAGKQAHQVDQLARRVLTVAEKVGRNQRDPEGRDLQLRDLGLVVRRNARVVEDELEQSSHGIQNGQVESARAGMACILLQLPQHQGRRSLHVGARDAGRAGVPVCQAIEQAARR